MTSTTNDDSKPVSSEKKFGIDELLYLMERLRTPETGCPWDLKQSYESIVPSTLEEVYEVVDAIERKDFDHLKEELGDLLFQIVFYTQLASEEKRFSFDDVVHILTTKLIRRHPHVFPDGQLHSVRDGDDPQQEQKIKASWEKIKEQERLDKGLTGILDDVPLALTAMNRASKLQKRAAKVGFDWSDATGALNKVEEELGELKQAIRSKSATDIVDEFGDLIFSCVNLSRHLQVDAEQSLRFSTAKFEERIRWIETKLAQSDSSWEFQNEAELDALWEQAKRAKLVADS